MKSSANFLFRVLLDKVDGDSPQVEIWIHEHRWDQLKTPNHFEEWVNNHLQEVDWRDLPEISSQLSGDKCYELLGKGLLKGSYSWDGEYDEDFDVKEISVREIEFPTIIFEELTNG